MSEGFLGELKIVSFNFAPRGWAQCNGQLLPINQNQALFSLLGTTYGGNGQTTFALPDLRGRAPIHAGQGFLEGQKGGEEFHTVIQNEMPAHNHVVQANSMAGNTSAPNNNFLASISTKAYGGLANLTTLSPGTVSNAGGSQAHENRQPFAVLNIIICLIGIFPSRN